jgi:hypothetical protein
VSGNYKAKLEFCYGNKNPEWVTHVRNLLVKGGFECSPIKTRVRSPNKRTGNVYTTFEFATYRYAIFGELRNKFYILDKVSGKFIKRIPSDIIISVRD